MINAMKTAALLALLNALFFGIGWLCGGTAGAVVALCLAVAMNFGTWFYSDALVLKHYRAQQVQADHAPELYAMVQRLALRAKLPMPRVYIVNSAGPNAFATGRDPDHAAIGVTEGLLRLLPEDELEGVIAHELSHIAHRDTLITVVAASLASAISWLTQLPYLWQGRDGAAQAIAIALSAMFAPLIALVLQMGISRAREFEADASAGRLTQNPLALARALQRLETGSAAADIGGGSAFRALLIINPARLDWLAQLFSTHPSTTRRIERLEALAAALD